MTKKTQHMVFMLALTIAAGATAAAGTPEQFGEFLRKEAEKWGGVIRAVGIKPQ